MKRGFYIIKLRSFVLPVLAVILSTVLLLPVLKTQKADANADKIAYLTFDDGPSAVTEEILDILKEENIKATFFVIGPPGAQTEEQLCRIVEEGHTVGAHSMSHNYDEIYSSKEAFFADLEQEIAWIYSVTGVEPKIFRFPGGSANTHAEKWLMQELIAEAEKRNLKYYDWNCDSRDSLGGVLSSEEIVGNILSSEAMGGDEITVLMHDSSTQKTAPEALKILIEELRKRGYAFESLK